MSLKTRKSSAHLIISSAQLGVSEDIVKVMAKAAEYYGAKVYHLGATITEQEFKSLDKNVKGLASVTLEIGSVDHGDDEASSARAEKRLERLESRKDFLESEIKTIRGTERERLQILTDHFGSITAVVAPDMHSDEIASADNVTVIEGGLELSKYMYLSAVQPSGERVTGSPITANAMSYLQHHGKHSWIVAHPVPAIETLEKPGLNQAHKFYTVGSLQHIINPRHSRQFFRVAHMPCAIMVLVDEETGEYHAKQMHIDYQKGKNRPMILDDGMVIFGDKIVESSAADKGSISTDDHAPHQHPGTLGALRAMNTLHRPGILINNGDAGEFGSVSHWIEDKPLVREGLRLVDDLLSVRMLLDAQANVDTIKTKVLIDSNHHEWVTQYVEKNPALEGSFDWPTLAEKMFPDWEVFIRTSGENRIFRFGDMLIRHGDKEPNLRKAEKMSGGKYLCGHYHRYNVYRRAVRMGCGAGLGPNFIGNQVTCWISQIGSLTKNQGVAAVNPKIILHDDRRKVSKFAYRNGIYEAPYYYLKKLHKS
jgi:hypothetical protein